MSRYERLKEKREARKAQGLCIDCANNRGKGGTSVRCRPCAKKANYPAKMRGVAVLYACGPDLDSELGSIRQ